MNDLDLIRDLVPDARLLGPAGLAPARSRLAVAINLERETRCLAPASAGGAPVVPASAVPVPAVPTGAVPARSGWRRRLTLVALAAGAVAVIVAGLIVVTTGPGQVRGPGAAVRGPVVDSAAAAVLHKAALAALQLPYSAPRPNQFVYLEFVYGFVKSGRSELSRQWLSVDGTRTGLMRTGAKSWVVPGCPASAAGHRCTPAPAFLPDLPTTPRSMLVYLERTDGVQPGSSMDDLNKLGKAADELLTSVYLLPKQRAALYDLLARTPGFSVVPHTFDAAGRPGIGISWPFLGGSKTMIIFDPRTYAELGLITWGAGQDHHVEGGSSLLKIAIVDRVGQLP
jgi:hypothetical protein